MKIIPNQTFKHERETYEKGKGYDVSDEDAEYFKESGWVGEAGGKPQGKDLNIQSGMLGQKSEVK